MKRFLLITCVALLLLIMVVPVTATSTTISGDSITTISPAVGQTGQTVTVTITGVNFTTTPGTVRLEKSAENNIDATITSWSSSTIVCQFIISRATGTGDWDLVVVKGFDSTDIVETGGFTITQPPTLTSITPTYALVNDNSVDFTLLGTNLGDVEDVYIYNIAYDNISADNVDVVSSTKIRGTFNLTDANEGTYDVCVKDWYGTVKCGPSFEVLLTSPSPTTIPTTAPGYPSTYGDFSVLSMSVDPSGYVSSGTPVNIIYELGFTGSGDETFPSGNELQMSTDLDSPTWTYSLILDGVDAPQPSTSGRVLTVSGWVLSYPSRVEETMRVNLKGTKPVASCPSLVQIQEVNSHNLVLTPFYQYWDEDCNAGLVSRTLPAAVNPGSQFTVNIVPHEHLLADPGWKVSELIPYGFNFVSTTAFHTIQTGPSSYQFIQNSNIPISYVLKAPATEGPYSFSGRFTDAYKSSGTVDGDTVINVGTTYANYLNATTEKIEREDARKAMNDNLLGLLSNQGAGSVLENYFLGQ